MITLNENFQNLDPRCIGKIHNKNSYIKVMLFSLLLILIVPFFIEKN